METKRCSKCKKIQPVSEFGKNPKNKSGYGSHCKSCKREYSRNISKTASGIYNALKGQINFTRKHEKLRDNRDNRGYLRCPRKALLCTKKEFIEWYDYQPKVCAYCGIKEEDLYLISDTLFDRHKYRRLTIDAIDNNKGYSIDNMVLCCSRCNLTKNNFFTYNEMKTIGKIVNTHWQTQLTS